MKELEELKEELLNRIKEIENGDFASYNGRFIRVFNLVIGEIDRILNKEFDAPEIQILKRRLCKAEAELKALETELAGLDKKPKLGEVFTTTLAVKDKLLDKISGCIDQNDFEHAQEFAKAYAILSECKS